MDERKQKYADWPIQTASTPTADGKGRLFLMEPGKRVVLGQWDQWQSNDSEPMLEQGHRVFFSDEEIQRRKDGARRLRESFSRIPFYAEAAKKHGDEDAYWEGFYASRIHW